MDTLMHDMQYRMQCGCQQSSYNQPPHPSFYLGTEAPLPARPNVKLNNTPPEPISGTYIKNLNVLDRDNMLSWQLSKSSDTGSLIYGDRDFTYTELPECLKGKEAIMTACNSKNTFADLAEFTASENIDVFVLLDTRVEDAGSTPAWLSGWTKTDMTAASSNEVRFSVYKKTFVSGEKITLGQNGMNGNCMNYTVFADAAAVETTTTTTETTTTTTETTTTTTETTTTTTETTTTTTEETTTAEETTTTTTTTATEETTTTTTTAEQSTLLGDANVDGKVSVADAVAILQAVANKDKYSLKPQGAINADCYDPGDGVTANDALAIQKLDAGSIDKLPEYSKK
jgi:rhamnogalacturonan endolyase